MTPKSKNRRKKLTPDDPEFMERIAEAIRAMTPDELHEMLTRRTEGVEETNMNEDLREYYKTHEPTRFQRY